MNTNTDEELIHKISMGDRLAFATLLEKYKSMVYGFSFRILNNRILAEETSQETWMRVIERAQQFQGKSKVSSWILSITKNLAIDVLKQNNRWNNETEVDFDFDLNASQDSLISESQLLMEENLEMLKQKISQLPDKQRTAIVLTLSDENASQSELAQQMGVSVNAFKVLIFKAKENLKKLWKNNDVSDQKGEIDE